MCSSDGWRIETFDATSGSVLVVRAIELIIDYGGSGCDQDATLVVALGTINNTVDIVFDYDYDDYDAVDQFTVTLYNETTSSVESTITWTINGLSKGNF